MKLPRSSESAPVLVTAVYESLWLPAQESDANITRPLSSGRHNDMPRRAFSRRRGMQSDVR